MYKDHKPDSTNNFPDCPRELSKKWRRIEFQHQDASTNKRALGDLWMFQVVSIQIHVRANESLWIRIHPMNAESQFIDRLDVTHISKEGEGAFAWREFVNYIFTGYIDFLQSRQKRCEK